MYFRHSEYHTMTLEEPIDYVITTDTQIVWALFATIVFLGVLFLLLIINPVWGAITICMLCLLAFVLEIVSQKGPKDNFSD